MRCLFNKIRLPVRCFGSLRDTLTGVVKVESV
jgi:hypothetical protein